MVTDPVALAAELIRHPSVTPDSADAVSFLHDLLSRHGFACTRIVRGGICNLHARSGGDGPTLGFNGHADVVPAGDSGAWSDDPFGGTVRDGRLWGRGACDMKAAVAAFVAAAIDAAPRSRGALAITIAGDEEGDGVDGTAAILDWMAENGERMDACIVGEPTCPSAMGEMMKIGRRGSMTAWIDAQGVQGHSAYPHLARNPVHAMVALLSRLTAFDLPDDSNLFDPTSVQVTGFDTGNAANNVIPERCRAMVNIRFNDAHRSDGLRDWIDREAAAVAEATGVTFTREMKVSGESFVTEPGAFSDLVARAVEAETGIVPIQSTTGGTSDARFIRSHCPVVEFGLVNRTMHAVDENVETAHVHQLKAIYARIIREFLG